MRSLQPVIEALQSGRYLKGVQRLHYTDTEGKDRYCCLGVICDLHDVEWIPMEEMFFGREITYMADFRGESPTASLPEQLEQLYGLDSETLWPLNDGYDNWDMVITYLKNLESERQNSGEIDTDSWNPSIGQVNVGAGTGSELEG